MSIVSSNAPNHLRIPRSAASGTTFATALPRLVNVIPSALKLSTNFSQSFLNRATVIVGMTSS
jgi:dynactin complex subunit